MARKPLILCLHGFTSNGRVHAHQIRRITAPLAAHYDFVFPDGPHTIDSSEITDATWRAYVAANSTAGHRGWWFARDGSFVDRQTGVYFGLETSVAALDAVIEASKGPVAAICGFSQGACFAGMLLALLSERGAAAAMDPLARELRMGALGRQTTMPVAGVFFSGFKARFEQYQEFYAPGIQMPTLHVIGEGDALVSAERSEELLRVCKDGEVLRHPDGHNIPKSREDGDRIAEFLRKNVRWTSSDVETITR